MGKAKDRELCPPPEPPGGPRVQGITAILHPISDVSVGQGRREVLSLEQPMIPESSSRPLEPLRTSGWRTATGHPKTATVGPAGLAPSFSFWRRLLFSRRFWLSMGSYPEPTRSGL